MAQQGRPERRAMRDFAGRPLGLSTGPEAWECLNPESQSRDALLLGIGPGNVATLPFAASAIESGAQVFWLEAPELLAAWEGQPDFARPPEAWKQIGQVRVGELARACRAYFYKAGARLAPDFWLPLIGQVDAANLPRKIAQPKRPRVWLPGNDKLLLWPELRAACAELNFEVDAREAGGKPAQLWPNGLPEFILSINFRGLDPEGRIFSLAQALGIPVAIWLVDNPWHLLSGVKLPWWKQAALFLTDPTFISGLEEYGAQNVNFLPLACARHMWRPLDKSAQGEPLFIGRSAFPGKERFFSGLKMPEKLAAEAAALPLGCPAPPDFHWWRKRLQVRLWPGLEGRLPGFCAEHCSMRNRAAWLEKMPRKLLVRGDDGWKALLPGREILPPVDYYGKVADLYQASPATLNVTSWLLPGSLNQRHFDVWAAGGFLLGDDVPGLNIFPRELADPIRLRGPEEFGEKLNYYSARPDEARDLRMAWRGELRARHLYRHRLERILSILGIARPES